MREIQVLNYKVHIGKGAITGITGKKCIIISDTNVYPLYGARIEANFDEAISFVIPAGEESKCIRVYEELLTFLAGNGVDKSDQLIALGGGVVGDLTGFVAATYMRGLSYIQVPTTLLAAVDSSIGGKTAINLAGAKNLVGAIHQPDAVYFDTDTLSTLDKRQLNSGMAEVIKYAVLSGDKELMRTIEKLGKNQNEVSPEELEEMIAKCVEIKKGYVEKDSLDRGDRKYLNLGHTVGHAVEALSGYELLHGEAVSIGMIAMAKYGEMAGLSKLKELLDLFSLPTEMTYPTTDVKEIIKKDKKALGESIMLVVPKAFGDCELRKVKL